MPASVHLFDDTTLARYVEEAGLVVESARLFRRADLNPSLFLDGRETVALIAVSVGQDEVYVDRRDDVDRFAPAESR